MEGPSNQCPLAGSGMRDSCRAVVRRELWNSIATSSEPTDAMHYAMQDAAAVEPGPQPVVCCIKVCHFLSTLRHHIVCHQPAHGAACECRIVTLWCGAWTDIICDKDCVQQGSFGHLPLLVLAILPSLSCSDTQFVMLSETLHVSNPHIHDTHHDIHTRPFTLVSFCSSSSRAALASCSQASQHAWECCPDGDCCTHLPRCSCSGRLI